MSKRNSMANNPLTYNDPEGDIAPLVAIGIGAGIAALTNTASQVIANGGFNNWSWTSFATSVAAGAIGGAMSWGIGEIATQLGTAVASGGAGWSGGAVAAFQAGAHGLSGGMMSAAQGGNFWSGAASGALSSGMSSGASALGIGDVGMIGIGGLSGGVGSSLAGGNFWQGVGQGLITSGLNHAAHVGYSAIEAGIHVRATRAFFIDSGFDADQVECDVVKQTDEFFGKYYAKLLNHKNYTSGWTSQLDSRTGKIGLVSPAINGYSLKYYHYRKQSIGLIRTGAMHYFEAGLEIMDGAVRSVTKNNELWTQMGYQGGLDNTIYDMHGRNSRGYLKVR